MQKEQLDLEGVAQAVASAMPPLDSEDKRIALALYRLLAKGAPVSPATVAEATGLSETRVREALTAWPGVFFKDGSVTGFWGLALPEMGHRFLVDGAVLHTWCAWDALFVPELIGRAARVESKDPVNGEPVVLNVLPAEGVESAGGDIWVSFLDPAATRFDENVVLSFCHYIHFFTSPASAAAWVSAHPGVYLLSLEEALELGRRVNRARYGELLGARI